MKKLILNEEELKPVIVPKEEKVYNDMGINSMVSSLIQNKWDQIDTINGIVISLDAFNRPDIKEILKNIISEEYIHIGQLEKVVQSVSEEALGLDSEETEVEIQ